MSFDINAEFSGKQTSLIGRFWARKATNPGLSWPDRETFVEAALARFLANPGQPVAFVGEAGSGKTWVIRALHHRLTSLGWTFWEATPGDIVGGMLYVGALELRLRQLLSELEPKHRRVWYCPELIAIIRAGAAANDPRGLLDLITPAIRRQRLCLIGEADSTAWDTALQERPMLRREIRTERVVPADRAASLSILRRRVRNLVRVEKSATAEKGFADDVLDIAERYFSHQVLPGRAIAVMDAAVAQARLLDGLPEPSAPLTLNRAAVLRGMNAMTGLPDLVIDESSPLNPDSVRAFFEARVMGQPEALDCLVERIAMIKAGLTDPSRPIGVFLFAGPTGTGKTEVVKATAEYLFGSADRMLRVDMSELQTGGSLARLIGTAGDQTDTRSLVSQVRAEPFRVILLDEFEKAHPSVWDLFLQVFDDARLTDANGRLADFRHCLIVLTSNLGSDSTSAPKIGFLPGDAAATEAGALKAVADAFRPEFVNRIDRVVVFRALTRGGMRAILRKELDRALTRPGFRARPWAVEWESSAVEFLLDKGFTPDMGARPLRRAIERYVLAPLAITIAARQFPKGDQFLFVRSDGQGIQVEFIDPDAGEATESAQTPKRTVRARVVPVMDIRDVLLDPRSWRSSHESLRERSQETLDRYEASDLQEQHAGLMQRLGEKGAGFVTGGVRGGADSALDGLHPFDALERIERVAALAQSLASMTERLEVIGRRRRLVDADLIAAIALHVYLVENALHDLAAGDPGEVLLAVTAAVSPSGSAVAGNETTGTWVASLAAMYAAWAGRRMMRLEEIAVDDPSVRYLLISGPGVCRVLSNETGLHAYEQAHEDPKRLTRALASVVCVPLPGTPPTAETVAAVAARASDDPRASQICRRYQRRASPIVKDLRGKWRSGRLDTVLDGQFDLFRAMS